ncbi:MAG: hypothetical protein EPO27_10670 [Betaproteobacteria bacterium]|nr:MAG: hypothetical protein EPO27_10670 [Betaproteobacteria bacterium]
MMAWRRIFGFIPVPVVYTDRLPEGVGGRAIGPLVQIRPKYRERGDEGLHQHELDHVKQFWRLWLVSFVALLWPLAGPEALDLASQDALAYAAALALLPHTLLYHLARPYRLYAEAHAYKVQTRYPDGLGGALTPAKAAMRLTAARYRLDLTFGEALEAIKRA